VVRLPNIIEGNYKLTKYYKIIREQNIPLLEILIKANLSTLFRAYSNKNMENKITDQLNKKISGNKRAILFLNLLIDDSSLLTNRNYLSSITKVINDIYYSHPSVVLVSAPNLIVVSQSNDIEQQYMDLLKEVATNTQRKLVYFIPSYLSISQIEQLVSWYINKYGNKGLLAIDCSGERFSTECYKKVAIVNRIMKQQHIDDYGIYLFDLKPHKKTSKSTPSEELLAILHGINLIGPLHTNKPIPPQIAEKLHQEGQSSVKEFNKDTYLYEPIRDDDYVMVRMRNDMKINEVLQKEIIPSEIKRIFSQQTKTQFLNQLEEIRRKYNNIIQNNSITTYFSI
jgi:hypothetical protein